MARPSTPHVALQTASAIARENFLVKTGAELARRTKEACPDVSLAACRRAADQVLSVRLARTEHTKAIKGCSGVWKTHTPDRTERTPEPVPALAARLLLFQRARIRHAFQFAQFRIGPRQTIKIEFGAPRCHIDHRKEWVSGRRGFGWVVQDTTVTLTVPERWTKDIYNRHLDTESGLMCLSAEQVAAATGDIEVYSAVWIRQGKGYSVETERGCIALHVPSGTLYHSTSNDPVKAARGLARKLTAQAVPVAVRDARRTERARQRAERQAAGLARLVERFARWDLAEIEHVTVTPSDSIRAGNCRPGTDDFVERFFPGRSSATIGEIAAQVGRLDPAHLTGDRLTFARQLAAACLVAIRRDRSARRLLTQV